MSHASLATRLHYRFDNLMAKGPISLIILLTFITLVLILLASILFHVLDLGIKNADGEAAGFAETLWFNLMHTLDPGAVSGDQGTWSLLFSSLLVSMAGLFIASTLIGLLTTGIDGKLSELRKGRSRVVEEGHTVILGWSPNIFSIISNLLVANANRSHACIAILADRDKVEMEDELRERLGSTGTTRIVCRCGDPMDPTNLAIVNPDGSRSIIIISPDADDPDAHVLKTILAITHNPKRRKEAYNIVAEIKNEKNVEIAEMVGQGEARMVLAGDLISRIAVQTCRQSGLSRVYMDLLDFEGNEIYFSEEPRLIGSTFGNAMLSYRNAAIIGVRSSEGTIELNPSSDRMLRSGEKLIAVAEDDDKVIFTGSGNEFIDDSAIRHVDPPAPIPERTLILGWNRGVPQIVSELDNYVAAGSETLVVADVEIQATLIDEVKYSVRNQNIRFRQAATTTRQSLDTLDVPSFDHVIVVPYLETMGAQAADAATLITLLHLREIGERQGRTFSIVSEMLDVRNRELAEVTRADDFIVDEKLVSLMLSQVSENSELSQVFAELFNAEGSEIYLKGIANYVVTDRPVNFYTVVESALRRGEVAIGYRIAAEAGDAKKAYGIRVNPDKTANVTFTVEDRVIVLAES